MGLHHIVQELFDDLYVEVREEMGTRKEFFISTTMFNFNKLLEFIFISRQSEDNINMEPYIM